VTSKMIAVLTILGLGCATAVSQTLPGYPESPLTGDWWGNRTYLADNGITFEGDVAHFYNGVASGGLDQRFAYGGHGDYVTTADMHKLGGPQGLFLKVRAEHRFGETINEDTGAFLPATLLSDIPRRGNEDLLLTNVLFTQMFSETQGVFFGKLDTLDGDLNAFAHGRGKRQFSNVAFIATPIGLRTIPYSTLGCGFFVLGEEGTPLWTVSVLNATDTVTSSGFDELFNDGAVISSELRLPTNFFEMPGHQLVGGTWSSRNYVSLGQDPRVIFPDIPIERQSDSWSLFWNCDQYLVTYGGQPNRGWGLFARAGVADEQTNPIDWFWSAGIGGDSPLRGRTADTFGVGYFYSHTSDQIGPILETVLGPLSAGQGVELYYNAAVRKWLNVTPDLQVLLPARDNVETAVVVGIRAVMRL